MGKQRSRSGCGLGAEKCVFLHSSAPSDTANALDSLLGRAELLRDAHACGGVLLEAKEGQAA